MRFSIEQLILWPRATEKPLRVLKFEAGKVNVVTGSSKTGKSAILPIINYCMCSGECRIPSGVIRQSTSWYGIVVSLGDTRILLARRDPDRQQQTGDMMLIESETISVPVSPQVNANADAVKEYLNKLAGLPSLELDSTRRSNRFAAKPSFRDMASFVFQPQWIVSNPNTLFFNADTTEHREKLRAILPLVLGAIAPEDLALEEELRDLKHTRGRLQQELVSRKSAADAWKGEVAGQYSRLLELNTAGLEQAQPEWTVVDFVDRLRCVTAQQVPDMVGVPTAKTIEKSTEELDRLLSKEELLSQAIVEVRHRLEELQSLHRRSKAYQDTLMSQRRRAAHVGWFTDALTGAPCPFCGSTDGHVGEELGSVAAMADEVEGALRSTHRLPAMYDRELTEARRDLEELELSLKRTRHEMDEVVGRSSSSTRARYTRDTAVQLVGQIRQSLANWDNASVGGELADEIAELDGRIAELERRLDPSAKRARQIESLRRVSRAMQTYAELVQVENPDDGVELSTSELTVKVHRSDGSSDLLSEIGSGANWMGYHVSALLALHEFFCSRDHSFVPALLVLDQPSQVYFPERWPGDPDTRLGKAGESLMNPTEELSRDLEGVHSIFETLVSGVERTGGELQVIVMDHADEITWQGLSEQVHLAARWRDNQPISGDALIPESWLHDVS